MDPSQGDMSATNLRLLNELHPHQPQVALTYKLSIKTSDQPDIFFYLLPDFLFLIFLFYTISPLEGNMKICQTRIFLSHLSKKKKQQPKNKHQ